MVKTKALRVKLEKGSIVVWIKNSHGKFEEIVRFIFKNAYEEQFIIHMSNESANMLESKYNYNIKYSSNLDNFFRRVFSKAFDENIRKRRRKKNGIVDYFLCNIFMKVLKGDYNE